jgi:hypothetical protein
MSLAQKVCTVPLEFRRYPLPDYSYPVGQLASDTVHLSACAAGRTITSPKP